MSGWSIHGMARNINERASANTPVKRQPRERSYILFIVKKYDLLCNLLVTGLRALFRPVTYVPEQDDSQITFVASLRNQLRIMLVILEQLGLSSLVVVLIIFLKRHVYIFNFTFRDTNITLRMFYCLSTSQPLSSSAMRMFKKS